MLTFHHDTLRSCLVLTERHQGFKPQKAPHMNYFVKTRRLVLSSDDTLLCYMTPSSRGLLARIRASVLYEPQKNVDCKFPHPCISLVTSSYSGSGAGAFGGQYILRSQKFFRLLLCSVPGPLLQDRKYKTDLNPQNIPAYF